MSDLADRDYYKTFPVELEWREWNRVWSLAIQGMRAKEDDGWSQEELDEDREIVNNLSRKITHASPGNGMDDWPDSMKEAYDETISEMLREELE